MGDFVDFYCELDFDLIAEFIIFWSHYPIPGFLVIVGNLCFVLCENLRDPF
jgi:hypothetical protein